MQKEPKEMLKALKSLDFVNLRHLTTRRDKGYVTPVESVGKGARPKYDIRNALIYCVGSYLESQGLKMDDAFDHSKEIIDFHITECVRGETSPWVTIFKLGDADNVIGEIQTVLSDVGEGYDDTLDKDKVTYLSPIPGSCIRLMKETLDISAMENYSIDGIIFINARNLVRRAMNGLEISLDCEDIQKLIYAERDNYMERVIQQQSERHNNKLS